MRKYIIGFIFGIALASTATAYGSGIGLVGKVVQGESTIVLDGKEIGTAITVDGKSYGPIRIVSESAGLTVGYEKGKVLLSSEEVSPVVATDEKAELEKQINLKRSEIGKVKDAIGQLKFKLNREPDNADLIKQNDELNAQLNVLGNELVELEKRKAALEAQ